MTFTICTREKINVASCVEQCRLEWSALYSNAPPTGPSSSYTLGHSCQINSMLIMFHGSICSNENTEMSTYINHVIIVM